MGVNNNFYFRPEALLALREAAESFISSTFESAAICANHAGRVTVTKKDLLLAKRFNQNQRRQRAI